MPEGLKQVGDSEQVPERRLHRRWAPTSLVYVELGGNNGGVILNIIEDGMALRAAQSLHGEPLPRMRFRLPRSQDWIETAGQIVWTGKSEKEIGVRFVDLPEAARDQIKHWIASETWSGEHDRNAVSTNEAQAQRASAGTNPEPTDWTPKSLTADAAADNRRRYKISSAIAAAAREGGSLSAVSSGAATPRKSASIPPADTKVERQISFPTSGVNAVKAAPISEKKSPLPSEPSALPRSARDLRLNLGGESAHEQSGVETPLRSWGAIAAFGILIIILSFAAGIAVGGRGVDGLIGLFQKFTTGKEASHQASMPNSEENSTSAATSRSTQPEAALESEPTASGKGTTSKPFANDSGTPSSPIAARELQAGDVTSHDAGAIFPATGGHNAAEGNVKGQVGASSKSRISGIPKPPVSPLVKREEEDVPPAVPVSNGDLSAVSHPESSPLSAASTPSQAGPPAVASPPKPEMPSGSVASSSHFRSIRVPPELRSRISELGNTLQIGELISSNQPAYPAEALNQRIEGTIRLHAVIGRDGTVQSIEPLSGPPLLMSTAINTVQGWRYKPTVLGGQPIERDEDITFVFGLKK